MSTFILNYWAGSVLGFDLSIVLVCSFIGLILALDEPLILSADLTY
jgi:hypothetical protein